MPHLLPYFPEPMERRRLLADPENEPNFSEIACLFYLPGDRRLLVQEARNRLQRRGIQIWDTVFESVVATSSSAPSSSSSSTATAAAYALLLKPPPVQQYPSFAALSVPRSPPALAWTTNTFQRMATMQMPVYPSIVRSSFTELPITSGLGSLQRSSGPAASVAVGGAPAAVTTEKSDGKPAAKKKPRRRTG
jgi:hypothetical protein